jgi:mycothiol synthase
VIELRAPTPGDFDSILELFAAGTQMYEEVAPSPDELRLWLTSPTTDLANNARIAFDADRLIAYTDVDPRGEDPVRWWGDVRLHPEANFEYVVPMLVAWQESRAQQGVLRTWAPRNLERQRIALEGCGLHRIRSSYRMVIDLDESAPDPTVPPGIDVRTLAPGEERIAYEVHEESFEDSWEHTRESYDEWAHYVLDSESFDPTLWFLAWDGADVAAVEICRVRHGMGWVAILGVRRPWRRRGLGRALLLHAFHEFKRRGFDRVGLGVDAESLTGANRLYESVGMRVQRQMEFYEKQLPSAR